jgi:glycosyltransferase involved in cell wall biosynthesis
MRAATFLRALAPLYNVHLHIVPVLGLAAAPLTTCVREMCEVAAVHPDWVQETPLYQLIAKITNPQHRLAALIQNPHPILCRFTTELAERYLACHAQTFHALHVFRLYLAPFAIALMSRTERPLNCALDCDDYESRTQNILADLYAMEKDEISACFQRAEAAKYAQLEKSILPRFDQVYLANPDDRRLLAGCSGGARVVCVPNCVQVPFPPRRRYKQGPPFTLLFIGTMNYFPNCDAALFFCRKILPRLRASVGDSLRVVIAGASPTPDVQALAALPGVRVTGRVADVADLYAEADVAIAPLRAGGGTRIKILEAFAQRCPVVSTSLGADGILARHGTHFLIADTPADFACAILDLIRNPNTAAALAERAFERVRTIYNRESVAKRIQRLAQLPDRGIAIDCE